MLPVGKRPLTKYTNKKVRPLRFSCLFRVFSGQPSLHSVYPCYPWFSLCTDRQHCRAFQFAGAKSVQRAISVLQGERFRLCFNRNTWCDIEEFFAVTAGEVCH